MAFKGLRRTTAILNIINVGVSSSREHPPGHLVHGEYWGTGYLAVNSVPGICKQLASNHSVVISDGAQKSRVSTEHRHFGIRRDL